MPLTDKSYNGRTLSFRLPHQEVLPLLVNPLKPILDLSGNYRHYDSAIKKGERIFQPGFSQPPYLTVKMLRLGNGLSGSASVEIVVPEGLDPNQTEEGEVSLHQIARILGIVKDVEPSQTQ